MPLPIIPDVMRVAIRGTTPSGTPWVNVIHLLKLGSDNWADAATNAHIHVDLLYGAGAGTTQGWADTAHLTARALDAVYTPLDGSSSSIVKAIDNAGTDSAEPMPPDAALCFTHRTALRGRSNRGRTYWSSYCEDVNVNGRANPVTVASQVAAWNAFRNNLAALTEPIDFVVASYVNATYEPVVETTCDNLWDRQRRRKQ